MNKDMIIKTDVSTDDLALNFGFSIFETFFVNKNGNVFLLEKHIERLYNSISFFEFDFKHTKEDFLFYIKKYIENNSIRNKVLRVTVTAGNKEHGLASSVIIKQRENPYNKDKYDRGFKLKVSDTLKNESSVITYHKTSNYLDNLLIAKDAGYEGLDDAVLLNSKARVAETTKCNIFYVHRGVVYTPSINCGVLPGIIRNWVIEECNEIGLKCIEDEFTLNTLLSADEVFLTNSVMGIMPVKSIGTNYRKRKVYEVLSINLKELWEA